MSERRDRIRLDGACPNCGASGDLWAERILEVAPAANKAGRTVRNVAYPRTRIHCDNCGHTTPAENPDLLKEEFDQMPAWRTFFSWFSERSHSA